MDNVTETPKSSPEKCMEIGEETKSTLPEKVQEGMRKTKQVFQNERLQHQQGTNICNGHLIDESWSLALYFCDSHRLSDMCLEGCSLIRFTCLITTWSKYSILFPKTL